MSAVDEYGEPFQGVSVRLKTGIHRYEQYTNEQGIAVFYGLAPGEYQIYNSEGISTGINLDYEYNETLQAGRTYQFIFLFPVDLFSFTITAREYKDKKYIPLSGVTLIITGMYTIVPYWVTTDSDGSAVLEDADPTMSYDSFLIRPEQRIYFERNEFFENRHGSGLFTYHNGVLLCDVTFDSYPYSLTILSPTPNSTLAGTAVRLTGDGYDFEDGELPDGAFTWYSHRDGELGTGRDVTADLSIGFHEITLRATDSCDRTNETDIYINVSHYATDSYFPLPYEGYWKYRFEPLAFDVINKRGETEHWILNDMTVSADGTDTRTCLMDWTVERGGTLMAYRYSLIDHISIDGEQFSVTSTDEQLTVFAGQDPFDQPVGDLTVKTVYTPSYLFLPSYYDPLVGGRNETTVATESIITYTQVGIGVHSHIENEDIVVSYEPGIPAEVNTPLGFFETVPVTSQIGDITRTWWLAKGIGIVQFETTILGKVVCAQLYETNLSEFKANTRPANVVMKSPQKQVAIGAENTGERLDEVRRIMRGLCPF
ncbi:hypothetical protein ACFL5H_01240 [Candidatus Latescibacterota bacterium]